MIAAGNRWAKHIWRTYGLTPLDVAVMYLEQEGRCALCPCELSEKRWVVDHKHVPKYKKLPTEEKRKLVRGLLCTYCNWKVLGQIERAGRYRTLRACLYLGFVETISNFDGTSSA